MDTLSEDEIWEWIIKEGLSVDMGYTIGGPFVDDGMVRIYDSTTLDVLATGTDIRQAVEDYQFILKD